MLTTHVRKRIEMRTIVALNQTFQRPEMKGIIIFKLVFLVLYNFWFIN